ncbi:MAG: tRNA uridine(34) 5-carboxymethylaminomethyl modification radical SAM/GNAT enzyme Elp3 [Candidatus Hadarchaeales archaeon]
MQAVKKPVRSLSGVCVITAMVEPRPCPHGRCTYCPGGPENGVPQSYTGKEPASARALQHGYDPYSQVESRVKQLREIGHRVDKVELLLFGGTLTSYPREYLRWFVKECLDALAGTRSSTLEEAQARAEAAEIRVSDIGMETRPDWCLEEHVDLMLELGITRVELGVQTIDEGILKEVRRGHGKREVEEATRIARDAGLSLVYHLMLGLPGSDPEKDLEMCRRIFEEEGFKPDAIKLYPTLVLPGTELYEKWKKGEYQPYPLETLVELLMKIKLLVPPWIRIQRIQRDIPLDLVSAGPERGDLRALVQRRMASSGLRCRCIRCREVGRFKGELSLEELELVRRSYRASGGEEIFLSWEAPEKDVLLALLRLRLPSSKAHRPELEGAAVVRELHVYGPLVPVGEAPTEGAWQHRGLGKSLLEEAEHLAEERGKEKIAVLSGIGVREYYRKLGYSRQGPYMCKGVGE